MGREIRRRQIHHVIRIGLGHHCLGQRVVRRLENAERNVVCPEKDIKQGREKWVLDEPELPDVMEARVHVRAMMGGRNKLSDTDSSFSVRIPIIPHCKIKIETLVITSCTVDDHINKYVEY